MNSRIFTLLAVAMADVARSAWVMVAVIDAERLGNPQPWLSTGMILLTGAISVGLLVITGRAMLESKYGTSAPPSA